MLTVLVTSGKLEDKPPRQKFTPRQLKALASASKGVYIVQRIDRN